MRASLLVISLLTSVTVAPVYGDEWYQELWAKQQPVKTLKQWDIEAFSFEQTGPYIFSSETVIVPLSLKMFLTEHEPSSKMFEAFRYDFHVEADLEKQRTIFQYRVFPGSLTHFWSRKKLLEHLRCTKQQMENFKKTGVGRSCSSDVPRIYVPGQTTLITQGYMKLQDPNWQNRNQMILHTHLFVIDIVDFGIEDFYPYDKITKWYDAIDGAMALGRPIIITFSLATPLSRVGINADYAGVKTYLTNQSLPISYTVGSLQLNATIVDVRIDF